MRPYRALAGACLMLASLAAGCSAPTAGDAADANGAITQGIVLVERSVNVSRGSASSESSSDAAIQSDGVATAPVTNVSAKFMRLSPATDPELAERMVGSPFDLPATGGCMVLSPAAAEESAISLSALGPIELLDAGDVTLKTGSTEMPLAARAFPDVGDLVFGVFYTSRDAAIDLPAPAKYVVESSGSGLLDRFVLEANAPEGPEGVRVDGIDLTSGITLDEGASANVDWRTPSDATSASATDLVYVDVTAARGAAVRCAFQNTARGTIPGSFLRSAALGPLPADATVAVHRIRRVPFSAPAMDLGEIRFDLSVIGRARIAAQR
jgi:hypothetical protein